MHQQVEYKRCPQCNRKLVLGGRRSEFAPKVDGKYVCDDCKVNKMFVDILGEVRAKSS